MRRRAALQAGLAFFASLAVPPARACEYFSGTLRITHPWAHAADVDAPFVVVSMKFDEVSVADRLIGADTPVAAGVELVGDLRIAQGRETELDAGGAHLRLVGLKEPLGMGRAYPLELAFEKGGIVYARLNIDFPRVKLPFQRPSAPPLTR